MPLHSVHGLEMNKGRTRGFNGISTFGLVIFVFLLLCCACAKQQERLFADYPIKGPESHDGYRAILATTDLSVGNNRVSFVLTSPQGFVSTKKLLLVVSSEIGSMEGDKYLPDFVEWNFAERGSYVDFINFRSSGKHNAQITFEHFDKRRHVELVFDVSKSSLSPQISQEVPQSRSRTLTDVGNVNDLSTGSLVHPNLYLISIDEATSNMKPSIVTFTSPAFCLSEVCGPQVEVLNQLSSSFSEKVDFIHIDIYSEPSQAQSNIESAEYSNVFLEWGLQSPQWTFLIDCKGEVFNKYQGFVTAGEIELVVNDLLSKSEKLSGCTI
jgi:hypothetical protein